MIRITIICKFKRAVTMRLKRKRKKINRYILKIKKVLIIAILVAKLV
jgi:hypothetical protein